MPGVRETVEITATPGAISVRLSTWTNCAPGQTVELDISAGTLPPKYRMRSGSVVSARMIVVGTAPPKIPNRSFGA